MVLRLSRGNVSNLRRHFRLRHPYIFAKETNQSLYSDDEDITAKINKQRKLNATARKNQKWVRKYITRIGIREHKCKICTAIISLKDGLLGNMTRHFKAKHPVIFKKENSLSLLPVTINEDNESDKEETYESNNEILKEDGIAEWKKKKIPITMLKGNQKWVNKYITRIGVREHKCNVCSNIIRLKGGLLGNMTRHFKAKHPVIFKKENSLSLLPVTINEDEESDKEETYESNNEILKEDGIAEWKKKKIPITMLKGNQKWVNKYITRIGVREHKCNVCSNIIRLKSGLLGNMTRHFKAKHPVIFKKEKSMIPITINEDGKKVTYESNNEVAKEDGIVEWEEEYIDEEIETDEATQVLTLLFRDQR